MASDEDMLNVLEPNDAGIRDQGWRASVAKSYGIRATTMPSGAKDSVLQDNFAASIIMKRDCPW
jgi:hypothetical protein